MALPSSGQISISQISTELGRASTATTSLGESASRSLAGVPSGAISMSNFWGKSSGFFATITTNQLNLNLRTWALANGWNGSSPATITVAPGVYIWSDSTSTPALTINGSWAGGITLINQGYIMGKGGNGGGPTGYAGSIGGGAGLWYWQDATSGGPAISLGLSVTINNTYASAYIGGGGGGGGIYNNGTSPADGPYVAVPGGGGAGGGSGGASWYFSGNTPTSTPGASGGAIGMTGNNGNFVNLNPPFYTGAGGGRIFTGTGGSGTRTKDLTIVMPTGGGAGGGGTGYTAFGTGGAEVSAGNGGSGANAGGNPYIISGVVTGKLAGVWNAGGGGGWGASGGRGIAYYDPNSTVTYSTRYGGAGGKAVQTNGYSVTWTSGNTSRVYGIVG